MQYQLVPKSSYGFVISRSRVRLSLPAVEPTKQNPRTSSKQTSYNAQLAYVSLASSTADCSFLRSFSRFSERFVGKNRKLNIAPNLAFSSNLQGGSAQKASSNHSPAPRFSVWRRGIGKYQQHWGGQHGKYQGRDPQLGKVQ